MSAMLWRLLAAIVVFLIVAALLPPVFRLFALPQGGDLVVVFRLVVAGLCLLYVLNPKAGPP